MQSTHQPDRADAGEFGTWLNQIRRTLRGAGDMDVPCGDCTACCSAHQFIHVRPADREALSRIPGELLFQATGLPNGHVLLGYDAHGRCPMLQARGCTVYDARPGTCREYDCRIFSAAGLVPGGKERKPIRERVSRWTFFYATEAEHEQHRAVKKAATFIRQHAKYFPGGLVPDDPSQLALLAIKAYTVFVGSEEDSAPQRLADAVVAACRGFDARP